MECRELEDLESMNLRQKILESLLSSSAASFEWRQVFMLLTIFLTIKLHPTLQIVVA
jgi:hypothetical protein